MNDKLFSILKKTSKIAECFHGGNCSGKVILAHSLQKNGKLSLIQGDVNGNLLIYTPTSSKNDPVTGKHLGLIPIGKKNASTFYGFCSKHDKELFQAIEDEPFDEDSDKHCFLHSYRAFAHSYHRHKEMYQAFTTDSDFTKSLDPEIRSLMIKGYEMGIADGETTRQRLNSCLQNEEYNSLEYFVYTTGKRFPIASSGCISPRYSVFNAPLNNHIDASKPFSDIMLTFFPDKDESIVIISAFSGDENGELLLDELDTLPHIELESIISTYLTFYAENTFFSPLVWDAMSKKEKEQYLKELDYPTSSEFEQVTKFQLARTNFFQDKFRIK